jgi:hypothetical protein
MITNRVALAVLFCAPGWAAAQMPSPSSSRDTAATPAKQDAAPALDFSGTLFANYQYRGDAGPAKTTNRFDVERVYLTFRVPAGKRASVRVTTDIFQQTTSGSDSYYRGWVVRAKYAYLQYNYMNGPSWRAAARLGLLHTVFIDHDEQFWPRWISTTPTDRAGYFASADAGIATVITLPAKFGEIYGTITNGPGYTSRETDRFKDYAARLTLTPWAQLKASPLRTLAFSAWGYKGATASAFVNSGSGQIGPVGEGLARDRWGVHAGSITPTFTFGAEYASRREEGETGGNTVVDHRSVVDSTGTLASAYAVLRPVTLLGGPRTHPLSLVGRFDRVVTNTDSDARYNVVIAGLIWDLTSKASFSLDYQETTPVSGSPIAVNKTYFAHFVARF